MKPVKVAQDFRNSWLCAKVVVRISIVVLRHHLQAGGGRYATSLGKSEGVKVVVVMGKSEGAVRAGDFNQVPYPKRRTKTHINLSTFLVTR
jgi:hypothetical protein